MAAVAILLYFAVTRAPLRLVLGAGISAAVVIAAVIVVNYHFTGHALGSYVQRVQQSGFDITHVPVKLYGYFFDSWSYDRQHAAPTVMRVVPLLALFPAGLFLLFRYERWLALMFAALTISWLFIYGAYSFVSGASLIYGSIHYVKVLFPLFIGCGSYAIARWTHQNRISNEQASAVSPN